MFRRPQYIALFIVVLVVLLLYKLPSESVVKTKLALGGLLLPFFGLANSGSSLKENSAHHLLSKKELQRQLALLQKENAELKMNLGNQQELLRENTQLREALLWKQKTKASLVMGRVIGRDPANWWRTIHINVGKKDGVYPNFPVRTVEGLIGRVLTAGENRSHVALLGDPNLRVGAVVLETRETGVIIPNNSRQFNQNLVDLGYLAGNSQIKPNQTVVSSGDGGIFPKGILIGKVVDSRQVDFGIAMEARVQLAADLTSLEIVWVMLP